MPIGSRRKTIAERRMGRVGRCRLGAVCRPRCRSLPLLAGPLRTLSCKLPIFLGLVLSSQAEGRKKLLNDGSAT